MKNLMKVLCVLFICVLPVPAAAGSCDSPPERVFLVRHAQKAGPDGPLSSRGMEMAARLEDLALLKGVTRIYVTEKARTRQTAQPLARRLGIAPVVIPSFQWALQVEALCSQPSESMVLVVGHSSTIPGILKRLGFPIPSIDYCELYEVDLRDGGGALKHNYCTAPH